MFLLSIVSKVIAAPTRAKSLRRPITREIKKLGKSLAHWREFEYRIQPAKIGCDGLQLTWQAAWNVSYMHCVHFMHPSGKEPNENFAKGRTFKKKTERIANSKRFAVSMTGDTWCASTTLTIAIVYFSKNTDWACIPFPSELVFQVRSENSDFSVIQLPRKVAWENFHKQLQSFCGLSLQEVSTVEKLWIFFYYLFIYFFFQVV